MYCQFRQILSGSVATNYSVAIQQTRNTFILKRRNQVPLIKNGANVAQVKLKNRYFIYDLVQDTNTLKRPNMKIILKEFVEGVGNRGEIISMRPSKAYNEFLLPGLAVYFNEENLLKYESMEYKIEENAYSSPYVKRTIDCLSRLILYIPMNKKHPWVLEPWHIKATFRKVGYVVPEHAIEMPPGEIKGPNLSLHDKEFYIIVTINRKEKVNVRCRIYHWATGLEKLPVEESYWMKSKEPLFPEQAETLANMPLYSKKTKQVLAADLSNTPLQTQ